MSLALHDYLFASAQPMERNQSDPHPLDAQQHSRYDLNQPPHHEPATFLIIISAQAVGSVGYALSLFAIWFGWLLPFTAPAPPPTPTQPVQSPHPSARKKAIKPSLQAARRPSAYLHPSSAATGSQRRRASAPVDLTPILNGARDPAVVHNRHVFFADEKAASLDGSVQRRQTLPPRPSELRVNAPIPILADSLTSSPLSTPSPLPSSTQTESTVFPPQSATADPACVEKGAESDSSRHSSIFKRSTLPKLKLAFGKGRKGSIDDKTSDRSSPASNHDTGCTDKASRRTSGSFVAPWLTSKSNKACPDSSSSDPTSTTIVTIPPKASGSGSAAPSPTTSTSTSTTTTPTTTTTSVTRTYFSRRPNPDATPSRPATPTSARSPGLFSRGSKSHKRDPSAPVPRTQPYGAPYFAAPPTGYQEYLKALPQFEQDLEIVNLGRLVNKGASDTDVTTSTSTSSAGGVKTSGGPSASATGRGRKIKRVSLDMPKCGRVQKRRSASEDWAHKPTARP